MWWTDWKNYFVGVDFSDRIPKPHVAGDDQVTDPIPLDSCSPGGSVSLGNKYTPDTKNDGLEKDGKGNSL